MKLKTPEDLQRRHDSKSSTLMTTCGLRAVRDPVQSLWFYYMFKDGEYHVTGSTKNHPKFYHT